MTCHFATLTTGVLRCLERAQGFPENKFEPGWRKTKASHAIQYVDLHGACMPLVARMWLHLCLNMLAVLRSRGTSTVHPQFHKASTVRENMRPNTVRRLVS